MIYQAKLVILFLKITIICMKLNIIINNMSGKVVKPFYI